jgi:hypothetical protein
MAGRIESSEGGHVVLSILILERINDALAISPATPSNALKLYTVFAFLWYIHEGRARAPFNA